MPAKTRQLQIGVLIEAVAHGVSCREAARLAGCCPKTVERHRLKPDFRKAVDDFRGAMLGDASGKLCKAAGASVETLEKLLNDESSAVRLGASRAILENAIRVREIVALEGRILDLEARLRPAGGDQHEPQ